jgi:hypothetical protein
MSSPVSYDLQGQGGGSVLAATDTTASGDFRWIQVITDTVFAELISSNLAHDSNLVGVTIPAGTGIGGRFSSIEVSTGLVIAYYA